MKYSWYLLPSAVLALCLPVSIAALQADDYAEGFPISVTRPGPIVSVPLTAAVYRASAAEGLADLAVFNGAGEPVALSLVRPPRRASSSRDVDLPLFPYAGEEPGAPGLSVTIRADGSLVSIAGAIERPVRLPPAGYLLDASHVDGVVTGLRVELPANAGDILAPVTLEGSDELDHWRPLVREYRLARLHYAGHTLTRLHIPVSVRGTRYLRLRFLERSSAQPLARVTAEISQEVPAAAGKRIVVDAVIDPTDPARANFDLGAAFPVTAVGVVMAPNKLFEATLGSRAAIAGDWQTRGRHVFYALDREGMTLRPRPVGIAPARHRYWRLADIQPAYPGIEGVQLEVAWQRESIVFLADGGPPYVLAVGRHGSLPGAVDRVPALRELPGVGSPGLGVLGNPVVLGGEARRAASTALPWQRIGLWSILILGVATAGLMVLRLLRRE